MTPDIYVTDDKNFKKEYSEKVIVGDAKSEAAMMFKELRGEKSFYVAMSAFGKLIDKYYSDEHGQKASIIASFLYRKYKLDEQETNHIHILFQHVFDLLGARVYEEGEYQNIKK